LPPDGGNKAAVRGHKRLILAGGQQSPTRKHFRLARKPFLLAIDRRPLACKPILLADESGLPVDGSRVLVDEWTSVAGKRAWLARDWMGFAGARCLFARTPRRGGSGRKARAEKKRRRVHFFV